MVAQLRLMLEEAGTAGEAARADLRAERQDSRRAAQAAAAAAEAATADIQALQVRLGYQAGSVPTLSAIIMQFLLRREKDRRLSPSHRPGCCGTYKSRSHGRLSIAGTPRSSAMIPKWWCSYGVYTVEAKIRLCYMISCTGSTQRCGTVHLLTVQRYAGTA